MTFTDVKGLENFEINAVPKDGYEFKYFKYNPNYDAKSDMTKEKFYREFTDKKFGKHYDTEILTVKRVIQPENFDNVKRTYLWRYTGAEFKDNIYLLYEIDGKKPKWVLPIVDPDGVLKFTINKLEDRDIVAVVRVKIKDK